MKDHHLSPGVAAGHVALRTRRRRLLLPPATRVATPNVTLPAPIIHGTFNGGLRRDQLLGDFATVQVTVGPWDFPAMTDVILLHWGDQWTQSFPVKDTAGAQLLAILGVDIAGDPIGNGDHYSGEGTQSVWYEIKTLSGDLTSSAATAVLVKTARPGGEDPRPDTSINDNLAAPTAAPDPVEQGTVEVTFSVKPWTNIVASDRLTLVLGGYRFDFPAITDTGTIQTLTLTDAQIGAIDGGPQTPVTYEIVDAVGNRSGYAPYLLLDIWLETGERLEMIELFNAAHQTIGGAIDPTMTDGFARVPRYVGWQAGESVTVVLEGVAGDETTHETRLGPKAWNATDYYLDFPLPGDALLVLAGGLVRVHYETSSGGIAYRRLYVVDALPDVRLPAVTVIGEQGGELALDDISGDYVSIVVPDSDALVDFARITLSMTGTGAGGPVREEEVHNVGEGEAHKAYTFAWLKTQVAQLLEHTATFSYTIRTLDGRSTPSATSKTSDALRLYRPNGIRDSELHDLLIRQTGSPAKLAPPIILDLTDGSLPPTLPKLRLTVPAGSASLAGAKVISSVAGLTTVTHTDVIFDDGEVVTVDFPGWPALNDGATAKAWYTIGKQGTEQTSQEASFFVGMPDNLPAPTATQASADGKLDPIVVPVAGADVVVPALADLVNGDTVTITFGTYTSTPPQDVQPGKMSFRIPPGEIAKHLAQTVSVFYTRRRGGVPTNSDVLTLQVGDVTDNDARIVKPLFVEANGTFVLDISTFPGDATIKITAWPLMAVGQRYRLNVSTWEDVAEGTVTTVGDFTVRLDRSLLESLANEIRGSIYLYVGLDTTINEWTSIHSPQYRFTAAATPFNIDTTPISLTGTQTTTRNATGGKPPYRYVSSNPNVVKVPDVSLGGIQAVANGSASITASDLEGSSKSYLVTVTGNAPPLTIDQTHMALTGVIYRTDSPASNPPPGSYGARQAQGGYPPYRYHAENANIVDVDPTSGRVVSRTSGTTRVIATDSANQQVAYSVSASNIQMVFRTGVFGTYTQCRQGAEAGGGRLLTISEWAMVRTSHNGVTGCGNQVAWTNDQSHVGKRWAIQPDSGVTSELIDFGIGGQTAVGWGLRAG